MPHTAALDSLLASFQQKKDTATAEIAAAEVQKHDSTIKQTCAQQAIDLVQEKIDAL